MLRWDQIQILNNDMQRLLVTGAAGLLGRELIQESRAREFDVCGTYHHSLITDAAPQTFPLDICDEKSVAALVTQLRPSIIIHAAALANVDECEQYPERAHQVNVEGTKNIAVASHQTGCKLILISADYVFDGKQGNYSENDPVHPLNVYGKTKAQAEEIVRKNVNEHIVIRTSIHGWGAGKPSFSTWILDTLRAGQPIRAVCDQFSSLMYAGDLAEAILRLVDTDFRGILHIGSHDKISKFDFAIKMASVFDLDPNLITSCKAESLSQWKAARPRDVSLNVTAAEKELNRKLPTIVEGIERMKREER